MELKAGYKLTEVGLIPEEWQLCPIGCMGEVLTGKALAVNAPGKQRPYLRTKNVFDGRIDIDDVLTMPMTDAQFSQFMLMNGDVLLNEGQSLELVGRCALYHGEYPEPCAIQNQLLRFRAKSGVSAAFASHLFRYCQQTGVFARIALQTTSIAHLGGKRFEQLLLQWPPEPEQRAIAAALNDADALLEGLTRLIAKKRDIKQAAMQQLLTGETRLPGFHEQWTNKTLGEIGECIIGLTYSPEDVVEHGLLVLRSSNIQNGRLVYEDNVYVNLSVAEDLYARQGDILICVRNGSRALIGKCALIDERSEGVTFGAFMSVYRTPHWRFIFHAFQGDRIQRQIRDNIGATINQITNKDLKAFRVKLPPQDEQTAIAAVLSDMDAELRALEARLDKTRALKQAMMQELLTGRTRLVVPAVTESSKDSGQTAARQANIYFQRSVLAAEIIDRLHDEPTFGHVKFEKMIYLVERLCDVDTGSTYHRDAAGPYDNRAMRSIDSQLRKQKWFDAQKIDGRYQYEPMANRGKHKAYFERYFGEISPGFDTIIDTFRSFDTERCEIVATLFAAWSDLLQQKGPISDEAIVNEVLHNWHESKTRIPEDRWRKELSWMRDHGFVPHKATGAV